MQRIIRAAGDAANEQATDYQYDGLNRLGKEIQYPNWPNTGTTLLTQYGYDGDSNRTGLVDPLNQTTTWGFDADNWLIAGTYSDGKTPNVAYSYDADSNRQAMADGTGTTSYSYDELDRLTLVANPGNVTVGYRYDLDGNRRKLIYPDGTAVSYSFDKAGRLASLADWANRTTSYGYFPDGHLQTAGNVDGSASTYSQDNAQRLTQVWNQLGGNTISKHSSPENVWVLGLAQAAGVMATV